MSVGPRRWAGHRVVVTGGASFIGSHLVDALVERGAPVRIVDDLSSGSVANVRGHVDAGDVEFVQADLRAPGAAARAVAGARTVFLACRDARVEKIVYASSGCVYPNFRQTDPGEALYLTEDAAGPPDDADNMYGWAKLMGELTLRAFARDWKVRAVACRYFTVYGPRGHENHAVMAMIARAFIRQDGTGPT